MSQDSEDQDGEVGDAGDSQEELDALEEAVASGEGEAGEELDPLAEEMLKMMEEEGAGGGGGEQAGSQEDVDRMMELEMLKAMEEEGGLSGSEATGAKAARAEASGVPPNIARLMEVSLTVTIELGRTQATLESVMGYGEQSLVELDKQVGDPVDVLVNGKLFARGEVVTVSENFGVRITELLSTVTDL
ncbi:MAG: flagellar motor switch protein FliN [Candidatus Latescibacterota bacterium]